jgi:D-glycero-alpha-D-manno-heptose 1-phosphate guanylyltransferase
MGCRNEVSAVKIRLRMIHSSNAPDKQDLQLRAFVLCGGLGTRLRSVVSDRPKSMAPVGGVPFLQLLLEDLKAQGIREVILGTGYMADQVQAFFRCGGEFGLRVCYSREDKPLGTGGALKMAEPRLSDPVVVLNGDSYVEWSLAATRDLFARKDASLVMILQAVPDVARYGSVTIEPGGRVTEFVEKGTRTGAGLINAGVYLVRKEVVAALPGGQAVSLERDVFPGLLRGKVYGLVSEGLFIDIGVPADLERAQTVLRARVRAPER